MKTNWTKYSNRERNRKSWMRCLCLALLVQVVKCSGSMHLDTFHQTTYLIHSLRNLTFRTISKRCQKLKNSEILFKQSIKIKQHSHSTKFWNKMKERNISRKNDINQNQAYIYWEPYRWNEWIGGCYQIPSPAGMRVWAPWKGLRRVSDSSAQSFSACNYGL